MEWGGGGGGFLGFETKRVPEPFGKFCVEPFKRQIEALLYNRIFLLLLLSVYVFVNVNKMRREPTSRVQGIVFILFFFLKCGIEIPGLEIRRRGALYVSRSRK